MIRLLAVLLILAAATFTTPNLEASTLLSAADVSAAIQTDRGGVEWKHLSWLGLLALTVGIASGLYVLVLIALPGRVSRLRGAQRGTGLILCLILSALFVGSVGLSLLLSIGHNSAPPADEALPFYLATLAISICQLALAIVLHRQRSQNAN